MFFFRSYSFWTPTWLFILSINVIGCGNETQQKPYTCVSGLCIKNTNDVIYDTDIVSYLIDTVSVSVNKYYPISHLSKTMADVSLKVDLYPIDRLSVGGVYMYGNQTINLAIPDSSWPESRKCLQMYYTLGHELIHFVDYMYLKNTTGGHNTSNLFFMGTTPNNYSSTSENNIWMEFADICGYDPSLN